jgi:hypothetical protein
VGPQALEALGVTAPRSAGEEARDEGAWENSPYFYDFPPFSSGIAQLDTLDWG